MLILCALFAAAATLCWPRRASRRRLALGVLVRDGTPPLNTPARWVSSRRATARPPPEGTVLVELLEAVASALAAGLPPPDALAGAGEALEARLRQTPRLATALGRLIDEARAGGALGRLWVELGRDLGVPLAARVGRAWAVSERLGSPLTDAVRTATAAHETTARLERAFAAQRAGPRATVHVLSTLPVLGLLLMPVLGVDLQEAYPPPVLLLAVLPGLGLLWLGRLATRRMVERALRTPGLS